MIDDLEAFIAEHRAKVSRDKQERKTEPRASTHQDPSRRNYNIPSNDRFTIAPTSRSGNRENIHLKPSTPEAGLVNMLGGYADKRQKLKEERREEYNSFLAGQNFLRGVDRKPNDFSTGPPQNDSYSASIPGLHNHPSAELRKMAERNHEYNEMLRNQRHLRNSPSSNRRGYESPVLSYEEILRKKRNEERTYRQNNDPEYYDPRSKAVDSHNRFSTMGEGHLSKRPQQEDPRFKQQQFEPKKVKFGGNAQLPTESVNFSNNVRSHRLDPNTEHYNSTLLIGERQNDDPGKKEAYRRELLKQMAETKELRERERAEKQRVPDNVFPRRNEDRRPTSWPTEEVISGRPTGARAGSGPEAGPRANQMPAVPQSYLGQQKPQFDENLPRSAYRVDGILANGFEFDMLQPRYQHPLSASSGIPLQTGPSLMPHNSQIDDAYFHYANQNPLDPSLAAGPANAVPFIVPSQPLPYASAVRQPELDVEPRSSYTRHNLSFERSTSGIIGLNSDDNRKRATDERKRIYQLELQKQVAEDKLRRVTEQQAKEKYDRRLEEEIANYNPFGRSGGGAPVKDVFGNIVTSRQLGSLIHHEPRQVGLGYESQRTARSNPGAPPTSDLYHAPPPPFKEAEKSGDNFARGGNGIFGEPMTQEQKNSKLKYQEELRLQMEEQKLRREKEKEKLKREDELLEQKIREDELKAAKELEEAERKEREKQEQLKQDQLAVKLKAEERKRSEEQQKKKEEDEAERERLRRDEDKRRQQKELPHRPRSPPIHSALTSLQKKNNDPLASPQLPAKRTQSRQSQVSHSYALKELANLRKNQQVELRDFENDSKRIQPEVYDPRIVLRPQNMKQNYIDVFELAKSGRPASVRRGPAARDPNNRQKFNTTAAAVQCAEQLSSGNPSLTDSLAEPLSDSDADAFDRSQRAVLRAQMKDLEKLNKENSNRIRHGSGLSTSERPSSNRLLSTTDYVPAFPIHRLDDDDTRYLPSDVNRRRRRRPPPNKEMDFPNVLERVNSVTSLDPEELGRKNDERLRKLKSLAGDDLSNDDPDDVVYKFMMRQTGRRQPSGDTLNDNSWMLPSAGH